MYDCSKVNHFNVMLVFLLVLPGVFIMAGLNSKDMGFFVPLRHAGSGFELFGAKNITSCPSPTTMMKSSGKKKHESCVMPAAETSGLWIVKSSLSSGYSNGT